MAFLQIRYGTNKISNLYLNDGDILYIGKKPKGSLIFVCNEEALDNEHAKIECVNNAHYIYKLTQNGGIYVNDKKIDANTPVAIEPGDSIIFADTSIIINLPNVVRPQINIPTPSSIDVSSLLDERGRVTIGNDPENDIRITDPIVEPFHTEIIKKSDSIYIKDLGSTSGTYLNGDKIRGEKALKPDDIAYIGLTAITIGKAKSDLNPDNAITAINISKVYDEQNIGLQPMNLSIRRGEFVALMGPSGCGKSTLLKTLTGDDPSTGGVIYLFGLEQKQHFKLLKKKIGYVPQEDIVHGDLKVYQTLYYAAKLRLNESTTEIQIQNRINEVLDALNINNDKIKHSRVKKLSGGQKKRVSIAVELLNKPSILFLDEPTSPLDPETIEEFLKCIQALCANGTTVVMVTHKPEDLNYADRVIFLGSNGYHVFDGKKEDILKYFHKDDLVQIYSLLGPTENSRTWHEQWYRTSIAPEVTSKTPLKIDRDINTFYQLKWLLKRNYSIKLGDINNLILQILQPVIIALLIALVFKNLIKDSIPVPGVLFMMNIATIWFGVSNSAKEIVGELGIYKRERLFNLKVGPYVGSKIIVLAALGLVQTFVLSAMIKINYQAQLTSFFQVWLFLWLINISASLLGLMISSMAKNAESVMALIPLALLPQNILAGIIAPIQDKITEFLSFLTLGRWGTEGLARIQDKFMEGNFANQLLNKNLYYDNSIRTFNSIEKNIIVILIMNSIFLTILIISLKKKDPIK
jgi:ABC-type multidrug transport system ATPase subunit/pSer/pThr/pTyr-binding forkhead associated (FHA) protein/ABC-type multidrug transport system permease subunit